MFNITAILQFNSKFYVQIFSVVPIIYFTACLFSDPGANSVHTLHLVATALQFPYIWRVSHFLVFYDLDIFEACRLVTL